MGIFGARALVVAACFQVAAVVQENGGEAEFELSVGGGKRRREVDTGRSGEGKKHARCLQSVQEIVVAQVDGMVVPDLSGEEPLGEIADVVYPTVGGGGGGEQGLCLCPDRLDIDQTGEGVAFRRASWIG